MHDRPKVGVLCSRSGAKTDPLDDALEDANAAPIGRMDGNDVTYL